MKTRLGLLLATIGCLTWIACQKGRPPSRDEVATIVATELKNPAFIRQSNLWLVYSTDDREGKVPSTARRDIDSRACIEALRGAGLIEGQPSFFGEDALEAGSRTTPKFVWVVNPAFMSQGDIAKSWRNKFWDRLASPGMTVVTARPELVAVTGITAPTEGMGAGYVEAQFTYRFKRTPYGRAIAATQSCPDYDSVPEEGERTGSLDFQKFDDGWRHGELKGNFGLPLNSGFG
jgi:hypothetical protein